MKYEVELELYMCEICNTQYTEKSKATECERYHVKPIKIQPFKYIPKSMAQQPYPLTVIATFEDGKEIRYRR